MISVGIMGGCECLDCKVGIRVAGSIGVGWDAGVVGWDAGVVDSGSIWVGD